MQGGWEVGVSSDLWWGQARLVQKSSLHTTAVMVLGWLAITCPTPLGVAGYLGSMLAQVMQGVPNPTTPCQRLWDSTGESLEWWQHHWQQHCITDLAVPHSMTAKPPLDELGFQI